jgi:hypothetical protein
LDANWSNVSEDEKAKMKIAEPRCKLQVIYGFQNYSSFPEFVDNSDPARLKGQAGYPLNPGNYRINLSKSLCYSG